MARVLERVLSILNTCATRLCTIVILGIRPLLGPASCRYSVGCTTYAITQLKTVPFPLAIYAIAKRVLLCNPFVQEKEL